MVKGCDHEIVRALAIHSKAMPFTFENQFVCGHTGLQEHCKEICDWAQLNTSCLPSYSCVYDN